MTVKREGTGQTAQFHDSGSVISESIASGAVKSEHIASGASFPAAILSGQIQSGHLANNAVLSGNIGSGQIGTPHLGDAIVTAAKIASGQVGPNAIASGAIQGGHIADAVVTAPKIASGVISRGHISSGVRAWGEEHYIPTGDLISGVKAVAIDIDGSVVRAERQSGLRLPAIGVTVTGAASGLPCAVVTKGFVPVGASGMFPTAAPGRPLYVGSGGLIVGLSGFVDGASSGDPFLSGSAVQRIGTAMSGGLFVAPEGTPRSGLVLANDQGIF